MRVTTKRLRRNYLWALQFEQNFMAWADTVGAPPWAPAPDELRPFRPDRMILRLTLEEWSGQWLPFLQSERFEPWNLALGEHPLPVDAIAIVGWRERVPFASLQVVAHITRDAVYLEVDFDIGNPGFGLVPLLIHGAEVLSHIVSKATGRPHVTNPFRMRRLLMRRKPSIVPAKVDVGWV